jgi:hypothetical protein
MWQELQQFASGLRDRMSSANPMTNLSQMQYGMPNNNPSLIDAFKRAKGLFTPQMMPNTPQKYVRGSMMSPANIAPPSIGANSPTAYGDVRSALASPYSPSSPNRMLQQTQY